MTKHTSDVVARLRFDAAQLLRMCEATKFGDDLSVRVKAPDLLISSMVEAADRIADLERLLAEAREEMTKLLKKIESRKDRSGSGYYDVSFHDGDLVGARATLSTGGVNG